MTLCPILWQPSVMAACSLLKQAGQARNAKDKRSPRRKRPSGWPSSRQGCTASGLRGRSGCADTPLSCTSMRVVSRLLPLPKWPPPS